MDNLNYQTKRLIKRVNNNYNDKAHLHLDPADAYFQSEKDPCPIEDLIPELETLFNQGADIILETNQGYDDEGGDCYQAYIIRPEFKATFQHYYDLNYERDGKCLFQLCIMEYITQNPEHIITLWAGPY